MEFAATISTCHAKDLPVWKKSTEACMRRLSSGLHVTIVPDAQLEQFDAEFNHPNLKIVGEKEFAPAIVEFFDLNFNGRPARRGWYLQQFLKLEGVRQYTDFGDVLIWDADTVPLKELRFRTGNQFLAYRGSENHLPYFMAIERAFGFQKQDRFSFIAQSFPVRSHWARSFFSQLRTEERDWFETLADSIDFSLSSGFSEYETLGVFIQNRFPSELGEQDGAFDWQRIGVWNPMLTHRKAGQLIAKHSSRREFLAIESSGVLRVQALSQQLIGRLLSLIGRKNLKAEIKKILSGNEVSLLQVGAGDEVSHDPMHGFISEKRFTKCSLFEPKKEWAEILRNVYLGREDVQVIAKAVGSGEKIKMHAFPEHFVESMDGEGVPNKWASGATSKYKSTLVFYAHQNSWRGLDYRMRLDEFIEGIYEFEVETENINSYIEEPSKTMLVMDVQGMEPEIIRSLEVEKRPKWVVAETDYPGNGLAALMADLGYEIIFKGSDSVFTLQKK